MNKSLVILSVLFFSLTLTACTSPSSGADTQQTHKKTEIIAESFDTEYNPTKTILESTDTTNTTEENTSSNLSYITITKDNWETYFEIIKKDIIPEKNAFGEYGTPEDMYYVLKMQLKNEYAENLVSINVSIEVIRDTYLQSYQYDKTTGIGTTTDVYKEPYNNTDTSLCNFTTSSPAEICICHTAGSTTINGETVYYGYICDSVTCLRAVGTIVLQNN